MDPSPWSPYSQQYSHVGGGSPQRSLVLPSPLPREDSINSYGSTNSHSLLMSSCQGLPSLPPRPNTADPAVRPTLLNSRFESSILSPPVHSSKDPPEYFNDNLYNGVCKENQSGIRSFIQTSGSSSRNESSGFTGSENSNSGFSSQVPPISFHSTTIDRPSPGPFGVLPHEAVRPNRFDRNSEKFITPVSKSISAFSTGSYSDHDVNSSYTSAPIPSQPSVFASDNASHSPIVNPVTSPSMSTFSSPNDYYSSPKPGFGPYNSMQSPLAQSPSVAQHSYPPSPYVDSGHISSAPPCSPMNGSSYVNNLPDRGVIVSQVPPRNGHKTQHSPSNNASGSSVICYNPQQTQNAVHHGPQPPVSKTPDYHPDYSVFSHDQNLSPSSYSSVYPAMHSAQVPSGSASRISPRSHGQHSNASHDSRLSYTLPSPLPTSTISSPTYMQSKASGIHDTTFGTCSSSMAGGQPLHPPAYPQCTSVIDSSRHRSMHPNSILPNHLTNDRQFSYQSSDITDDKNALDMFNSHIDSGVHNPDTCQSSISSFLENDLPILDPDLLTATRQLRDSDSSNHQPPHNEINMEAPGRGIIAHTQMSVMHNSQDLTAKPRMNYSYDSNMNIDIRSVPFPFGSPPRKRGRRGRRRKIDIAAGEGYPRMPYKNEHNVIFRNGYPVSASKFSEYGNRNCYNAYSKRYKESFENNDIPTHYSSSMFMPPFNNERKNCSNFFMDKLKSYPTIEDDLKFLGKFSFICEDDGKDIPQTFMKTRNKDSEGFLQSFLNFLEVRKTNPESEGESGTGEEKSGTGEDSSRNNRDHKGRPSLSRSVPKVIIKMGRCNNPGEWRLTETHVSPERFSNSGDESASSESSAENSSHGKKLKLEDKLSASNSRNMNSGSVHLASDRLSKLNSRRSFERVGGADKYSDVVESDLHFTNSETLVGGEMKRRKNTGAGSRLDKEKKIPKKRGRKAKNPLIENSAVKEKSHLSAIRTGAVELLGDSIPAGDPSTSVNPEDKSEENAVSRRLRARKEEPAVKDGDVSGSSSAKPETVGIALSSDEGDVIDDSDSDPAWTPSARTSKPDLSKICVSDSALKRRRKKIFRRSSTSLSPVAAKKRAAKVLDASKSDPVPKMKKSPQKKVKTLGFPGFRGRAGKKGSTFLIQKVDLNKERPSLWRLDNDTLLLQRFDPYEEQGVQLHRNTYAYAAWTADKESCYAKVNVKTITCSRMHYVIQYLGLQTSVVPSEGASASSAAATVTNPLRENFEVFLQTLISQALDPNFLSEITNENDEYFLSNIKEIEKVTENKKKLLVKDTWDQELKKCADIYPCVNILDHVNNDGVKCQVCGVTNGEKLLQFYGQPYDWTTLGSVESPLANKTQFNVCAICSATVSLYNRLHHQKYNFFIKCRTKMNQVKGDSEPLQSHALLSSCLSDSSWVNMWWWPRSLDLEALHINTENNNEAFTELFVELESIWNECDKKS